MEIREWKYTTEKDINLLDFHDVYCGPIVRRGNTVSFATTDGPNMSSEHPSNPYDAPMELGRSCISFFSLRNEIFELDAGLIDNGREESLLPRRIIPCGSPYEIKQMLVRQFSGSGMEVRIYGELREQSREFNDEMLTWCFHCSGFTLRWNSFAKTAWFYTGEHFRIVNGEIVSMGHCGPDRNLNSL